MTTLDENLRPFATERQWEIMEAIAANGGVKPAARALDVHEKTVFNARKVVLTKAARMGYSPDHDMVHTVPDGYRVKGVSTYFGADGQPRGQWVKSTVDQERDALIRQAALDAMGTDIKPLKPIKAPAHTLSDLLNTYTLTDYHLGMLAWHREGGVDWDTSIAGEMLLRCFSHMIASAPDARTGIVVQLGDFLHSDGLQPVTPTSGHNLDQDSRFTKIVETAIELLEQVINMALAKHENVHVILAEGNHDLASSVWLRSVFARLYRNNPRVTVDTSALPYYAHQHGNTMLGWHHGHIKKIEGLAGLFAAQFPKIWGATEYRYGNAGHQHHRKVVEQNGMMVTQHPTLAPRDAHAARGGWHSNRSASCETFHAEYGRVGEVVVNPAIIKLPASDL